MALQAYEERRLNSPCESAMILLFRAKRNFSQRRISTALLSLT
jgi:hypothetical protein